jgi:hypothetical protein
MNCLKNFIGILGCNSSDPESGIYINSLPGISLKQMDQIANEDKITYSGVWDDVQERAARRFETKVKAELSKRFKISTIQQTFDLTKNLQTTTTANSAKYRGFFIDLDRFISDNNYVVSNFQRIYVQQLFLYLTGAVNTTVKIFDAVKGTQLKSVSVTGASGWNTVNINESYTARKLFIAYDATSITGTDNLIEVDFPCCDCTLDVQGAQSDISSTIRESDLTKGTNGYGLTGVFSSQCTYDSLVCNNKNVFSSAWWYLLGSEVMSEVIYTNRLSQYTTIGAQKAKDLRKEFEEIFMDELESSVMGVNVNAYDCCLECNEQVLIKESLC